MIYLNIKVEPNQCRNRGLRLAGKDVTAFKIAFRQRPETNTTLRTSVVSSGASFTKEAGDRRARRCYRSLCSDSYHEDRIAFVHLAPLQDYGEHAGITAMLSCEIPQQLGCSFGGVRVERDHLATRVAFNNCQLSPIVSVLPTSVNSKKRSS